MILPNYPAFKIKVLSPASLSHFPLTSFCFSQLSVLTSHPVSIPAFMILPTSFPVLGKSSPFFFSLPAINPVYLFLPNHWEPQLMVPCLILMCCFFSLLNVRIFPPQAKDKCSLLEVFWHEEPCDIHSSFLCLYRIKYLENLNLYSGHIVGSHTV